VIFIGMEIKLTEQQLRKSLAEAVKTTLSEMDWRTYQHASEVAKQLANNDKTGRFDKKRRERQSKAFKDHAKEVCDKQYGIDKIKAREKAFYNDPNHEPDTYFEPTNGELKRMQRQSDDTFAYFDGNQEYANGKWANKQKIGESVRITESDITEMVLDTVKNLLGERVLGPGESFTPNNPEETKRTIDYLYHRDNRSPEQRNPAYEAAKKAAAERLAKKKAGLA